MSLGVVDRGGVTQTGRVRRSNEDSFLIREPLFVVADGMGGAQAGEIASQMAAEEFAQVGLADLQGEEALRELIARANERIYARAAGDRGLTGMGTTVTAALVGDGDVAFANVGDSRAYLMRAGSLRRLSDDHSLVGELVRSGELTEAEAGQHPQRSVITRVVGAEPQVEVDTFSLAVEDGDLIMLCSDGLNTMVDDAGIAQVMAAGGAAEGIARDLVRAALAAGGEDNVTAIVLRIGTVEEGAERQAPEVVREGAARPRRGRAALKVVLSAVVACALAAAAIAGLRWSHFVGADPATGRVAVYQGVPVDLGFGIRLYRLSSLTPVSYATLTAAQRRALFDHRLRSEAGARRAAYSAAVPP
ncbi:MAG TPA: Stp1/IreP family PP2C-type Ser/Thr phosphatase [Gaiellales bacterium]|nr:Stp1/IreP family PP2C-type Ser/Thr phosphatase [Gaiellales bacterium]